jgi:N-acetylglucosaminyl-diphospho-decaprenol L-rhamnosyltransferase
VSVAGIVVSHGAGDELGDCLAGLTPQVDELVVVANLPGEPLTPLPPRTKLIANERPLGLAANTNRAIAETSAPFILVANPDTKAEPGAVETLRRFMERRPRCGIAGPEMRYPDGSWQPSRRRFPTVVGTLVRRTPLRLLFPPRRRQRSYYLLDERPTEPVEADWMLGAFLLLRRQMLEELGGFDEGFRLYGEDIDLSYRAAKAGWERWHVPEAVVRHRHAAVSDRRFVSKHTLWHWRSIIRFVRKHPERLRAL